MIWKKHEAFRLLPNIENSRSIENDGYWFISVCWMQAAITLEVKIWL